MGGAGGMGWGPRGLEFSGAPPQKRDSLGGCPGVDAMSGLPFVLLSLVLAPTGRVTDSVRTLTAEELALYRLAVRDLVSVSSTAAAGVTSLVLDPTVYAAPPVGAQAVPAHATRLADAALVAVLRATGIDRACGPVLEDACEGSGRRLVVRLSDIRRFSPDSVRVVLR